MVMSQSSTPIETQSLAQIVSVVQTILATTDLDKERRSLPIIPQNIPDLARLEAQSIRLETTHESSKPLSLSSGRPSYPDSQPGSSVPIPDPDPDLGSDSDSHNDNDNDNDTLSRLSTHLVNDILPYLNLSSLSPNYYGFVIGGATPAALLGDFLASIYDQNVHVHLPHETIATALEVVTLNKLVHLFRLPRSEWAIGTAGPGGGVFTTGATASNVLGLALGREYVLRKALERKRAAVSSDGSDPAQPSADASSLSCGEDGIAELMFQAGVRRIQVLSTLSHSSMAKAASVVGIGRRNLVSILSTNDNDNDNHNDNNNSDVNDDPLRIDFARLEMEARKSNDGVLSILTISAGEVNTGRFATDSLDVMTRIRRICDKYGVWIHVDGAFGLFGRLFDPARGTAAATAATSTSTSTTDGAGDEDDTEYSHIIRGVQGLELADSITGDCHKLLNVPYDCGVFFTRHKELSEDVFGNGNAAYLKTAAAAAADPIQSPINIGLENSRRFRALPVYCTLMAYGREGYLDMLRRQISLARRVTRWLLHDARFEVLPGGRDCDEILAKTFIVVLFRVRDEEKSRGFVGKVNATGRLYLSATVWEGRPAARMAVSNWQVDVDRDAKIVEDVLEEVMA